jgi:hypothetical protein
MMVFLDANPVIYYVEQTPIWGVEGESSPDSPDPNHGFIYSGRHRRPE